MGIQFCVISLVYILQPAEIDFQKMWLQIDGESHFCNAARDVLIKMREKIFYSFHVIQYIHFSHVDPKISTVSSYKEKPHIE